MNNRYETVLPTPVHLFMGSHCVQMELDQYKVTRGESVGLLMPSIVLTSETGQRYNT